MARILRTSSAEDDMQSIWEYVAQDDPNAATALLQRFDRAFHLLADNPQLGEAQPEYATDLRRFVL